MKTLLTIVGPTGVGKTELSLRLAEHYQCPIINADSRQIYTDLPIGTAAPTKEEQRRVHHYFVGTKRLDEDYNAGQYERDATEVLLQLCRDSKKDSVFAILSGGSMLYIDAVCHGLDDIPTVATDIRDYVRQQYEQQGIAWLQAEVQRLDPDYWQVVDQMNPQRLMHCIAVSLTASRPYSGFRTRSSLNTPRPWRVITIGLERERNELYERIDHRVDSMIEQGLLSELRQALTTLAALGATHRPNSLNTVGYKELIAYLEGKTKFDEAIRLIKQNSRHYAKRQLTWYRRKTDIHWINATTDYEKQILAIDAIVRTDGLQSEDR